MKKQTAVEWLEEAMNDHLEPEAYREVFRRAKEMEREQIKSAYLKGDLNGCGCYDYATEEWAEEYYEQTYGGEKE